MNTTIATPHNFPPLPLEVEGTQYKKSPELAPVPLIRDTPLALSPVTQSLVLGNLDESSLVSMMASKAGIQDPFWFRTMVEGGLVDVSHEMSSVNNEEHMFELLDQFRDRSIALTSFLKNATWQTLRLPEMEGGEISIPVFKAEEEFKELFHQSAQRVIQSMKVLTDDGPFAGIARDPEGDHKHLITVASHWMAAACLLDSPKTLELLTHYHQPAIHQGFKLETLGDAFYEYAHDLPLTPQPSLDTDKQEREPAILVTPGFVALMLSRTDCLDILHEANKQGPMLLGSVYDGGQNEREHFNILGLQKFYAPVCTPDAFEQVLNYYVQDKNELQVLYGSGHDHETADLYERLKRARMPFIGIYPKPPAADKVEGLTIELAAAEKDAHDYKREQLLSVALSTLPNSNHAMRPYVRSFIGAGIFDFGIADSVVKAVAHGHPHVVENFRGRMPWDEILPQNDLGKILYAFSDANPIYMAAVNVRDKNQNTLDGASESAVLTYIAAAKQDGKLDQVLAHGPATHEIPLKVGQTDRLVNVNVVEPIATLVDANMPRAILKFLENGLDPQTKMKSDTPSVLETADLKSPEIGQTIRTFMTRKRAIAALDEMEPKAVASAGPSA